MKDFDLHALGKALDARRAVLGRSWSQVAAELGVSVPARQLRFDTAALYAALDGARGARGITWREVGAACGVASAAALTRLKRGGRTSYPTVARVLTWIGPPANRFVRIDSR